MVTPTRTVVPTVTHPIAFSSNSWRTDHPIDHHEYPATSLLAIRIVKPSEKQRNPFRKQGDLVQAIENRVE